VNTDRNVIEVSESDAVVQISLVSIKFEFELWNHIQAVAEHVIDFFEHINTSDLWSRAAA
jgi:hypothetical protein